MTNPKKTPKLNPAPCLVLDKIAMPTKPHSINLLKNTQNGFSAEFVNWALTVGRLLVIITEVIALAAFLYRFSLDGHIIDLRSQIKQKQVIIASQKDNEVKYRDFQDRLYLASNFSLLSKERVKTLKDILGLTPQNMKLKNLSLTKDILNITANAQGISSLTIFVNSLKKYPNIDTLSLDSIENKPSTNLTVVNISGTLKKSKYENVEQ